MFISQLQLLNSLVVLKWRVISFLCESKAANFLILVAMGLEANKAV